jgi:hypothetical protein
MSNLLNQWVLKPKNKTDLLIDSFLRVETGWHFGNGHRPLAKTVSDAKIINAEFVRVGISNTHAFLGVGGEIQITAYREDHFFECTIEANDSVTFIHEQKGDNVEYLELISLSDTLGKIATLSELVWRTSGLFIQASMTPFEGGFPALLSKTLVEESRFLKKNVRWREELMFAPTSENITLPQQVNQLFTGGSMQPFFQKVASSQKSPQQVEMYVITT